jgi:hypothetical protein
MGLGSFPEVSLAQAREAAGAARVQARQGIDPIDARRAARSISAAARDRAKTFDECAAAYLSAKGGEWANIKHGDQWRNTIATYASPVIGRMLVADVDTPHILAILEPLWQTKTETAVRLRGRLERGARRPGAHTNEETHRSARPAQRQAGLACGDHRPSAVRAMRSGRSRRHRCSKLVQTCRAYWRKSEGSRKVHDVAP